MKLLKIAMVCTLISSCASTPTSTIAPLDEALSNGAELVEDGMLGIVKGREDGVTMNDVGGAWRSYLGADGRIATQIVSDNSIKELSWSINEAGVFCQIAYVSEKEECHTDANQVVRTSNGTYAGFKNEKKEWEVNLEDGNPYNL